MTVTELKEALSKVPDYYDDKYTHLESIIIPAEKPGLISPIPASTIDVKALSIKRDYEKKEWIVDGLSLAYVSFSQKESGY